MARKKALPKETPEARRRRKALEGLYQRYGIRPRSAEERRRNRAVARVMFREAFDLAKKYPKRRRRPA